METESSRHTSGFYLVWDIKKKNEEDPLTGRFWQIILLLKQRERMQQNQMFLLNKTRFFFNNLVNKSLSALVVQYIFSYAKNNDKIIFLLNF